MTKKSVYKCTLYFYVITGKRKKKKKKKKRRRKRSSCLKKRVDECLEPILELPGNPQHLLQYK